MTAMDRKTPVQDRNVATFVQVFSGLLTAEPTARLTRGRRASGGVAAAVSADSPRRVVEELYQAVLLRPVEQAGLTANVNALASGWDPWALAAQLLASPEARGLPPEHRTAVAAEVAHHQARVALRRAGGLPPERLAAASSGDACFVVGVFQAGLGRSPSPDELAHELGRLSGGLGREQMLRAFARRPEVRARLWGASPRLRARVVRRIRSMDIRPLRQAVAAHEVVASVSALLSVLMDGLVPTEPESDTIVLDGQRAIRDQLDSMAALLRRIDDSVPS